MSHRLGEPVPTKKSLRLDYYIIFYGIHETYFKS